MKMQLLRLISFLEIRRLRTMTVVYVLSLALTACVLYWDFGSGSVSYSFQTSGDVDPSLMSQYFEILPIAGFLLVPLVIGLIISILAPWRSEEEWRDGHLQMLRMSQYSMTQIQWARLGCYSLAMLSYFCAVALLFYFSIAAADPTSHAVRSDISTMISYFALTICCFAIPLGQYCDSLRLAFRPSNKRLMKGFVPFLMWLVLGLLGFYYSFSTNGLWLEPIEFAQADLNKLGEAGATLGLEPLLILTVLGIALIMLSARIHEEIEP